MYFDDKMSKNVCWDLVNLKEICEWERRNGRGEKIKRRIEIWAVAVGRTTKMEVKCRLAVWWRCVRYDQNCKKSELQTKRLCPHAPREVVLKGREGNIFQALAFASVPLPLVTWSVTVGPRQKEGCVSVISPSVFFFSFIPVFRASHLFSSCLYKTSKKHPCQ